MIQQIKDDVFPEVFKLLPSSMDTLQAKALLLAIGLQESRFEHRKQVGGPAKGFWQFEEGGGIRGVMTHPWSMNLARSVALARDVPFVIKRCYDAVETDDVLACSFARLLLYTLPGRLPNQDERDLGWSQYIEAWRPGMPHRHTWNTYFDQAWREVLT